MPPSGSFCHLGRGYVALLLRLIRKLAAYDQAPDAVVATEDDLRRHGFGAERRFEVLLAFVDGKPAGFALFYPDFRHGLAGPGCTSKTFTSGNGRGGVASAGD